MLMQRKVFQSATEKPDTEKIMFEDSSNKLYQFMGEHAVEDDALDLNVEDGDRSMAHNMTQSSDSVRFVPV